MLQGSRGAGHDSAEPSTRSQAGGFVAGRTRRGPNLILRKEKVSVKWGLFGFKVLGFLGSRFPAEAGLKNDETCPPRLEKI